jgi:hypothetical protein
MNKEQAKASKNKRVDYSGTNRPWLKGNIADLRLTGAVSDFSDSVQVRYKDSFGNFDTTWVGVNYLALVNEEFSGAINTLKVKREQLEAELNKVNTAIKTLEEL